MPFSKPFSKNSSPEQTDLNNLNNSNNVSSLANSDNRSGSRKLSLNLKVLSFSSAAVLAGLTVFGLSGVILSTFSADNKEASASLVDHSSMDHGDHDLNTLYDTKKPLENTQEYTVHVLNECNLAVQFRKATDAKVGTLPLELGGLVKPIQGILINGSNYGLSGNVNPESGVEGGLEAGLEAAPVETAGISCYEVDSTFDLESAVKDYGLKNSKTEIEELQTNSFGLLNTYSIPEGTKMYRADLDVFVQSNNQLYFYKLTDSSIDSLVKTQFQSYAPSEEGLLKEAELVENEVSGEQPEMMEMKTEETKDKNHGEGENHGETYDKN